MAFLDQAKPDQPLALWVHYFDAHAPYQGQVDEPDPGVAYRSEVEAMDAAFGRLREAVARRGRPVIWWVLADHGEGLGEHGERTHGLFVYDSTVHIPMWLSAPGIAAGARDDLATQVDVLPTTLGLLGLPLPVDVDGINLLASKRETDAQVVVETALPYFDFGISPLHALRGHSHKYIAAPKPEFYDLATDPAEQTNLIPGDQPTGLAAEWSVDLDGYLLEYGSIDQAVTRAASADAETSERLRSLGYLSGSDMGLGQLDPKDAVALVDGHSRAVELAGAQRMTEAIDELDRVLVSFPGARAALYLRARLLAATGQYVAAEVDAKAINTRHPDADSVLLAAQLALLLRRPDDARVLLAEATRLDPNHGGALVVLGDLALQDGNRDQARAYFQQALDKDGGRIGRQVRARLQRMEQPAPVPGQ
ncbi:MAG: sulfatase-like hydrolase/transferase [Ahniella sp.]|nr:sulfatase-like hydrolase/transferase [Ahniella sp.]